jgi:hypothetical protein
VSAFDYVNQNYGTNACIGRRVVVYGLPATITADRGHYIGITYDTDKPRTVRNAHPVDGVVYLEEVVKPRKASRSARRYAEYLRSEVNETFAEWLNIKKKKKEAKL